MQPNALSLPYPSSRLEARLSPDCAGSRQKIRDGEKGRLQD